MWSWTLNSMMALFFFLLFLATLLYILWLRWKSTFSKARFAFAACTALTTCLFSLFSFLAGSGPLWIANLALSGAKITFGPDFIDFQPYGVGWLVSCLSTVAAIVTMFLIYRFSIHAIRNWEGPVTVTVNELAKREQDNDITSLAIAELKRLFARRPDPPASDAAINWQQRISEAPSRPPWHILAKELFESAIQEAVFANDSWRDRFWCWVGELYVSAKSTPYQVALFVFDDKPDETKLKSRIESFSAEAGSLADVKLFAVFEASELDDERGPTTWSCVEQGWRVEVWSSRTLLRGGLKLSSYARDLVRRFDSEVLGGTQATLRDTFVDAHVHERGKSNRVELLVVLSDWLQDTSRRHLAITGEYGQGKSTAMLQFCATWARQYLAGNSDNGRIPLLIELRGQSPGEIDALAFLSAWAGRYGLLPKQVYNLIQSGDAIVIFEGFDELRNAGRAFDRHEHFNALWRLAFPGTKLIFTGRPNFFIDEKEKNRTLRSDILNESAGGAFTQLWEIEHLTIEEVGKVVKGFGESLGQSVVEAARTHSAFFQIVSRPSMLPVVVTIWGRIQELRKEGIDLTSAILIEHYLQATYRRKEQERSYIGSPEASNYLLLPQEVREVFTLAVVWKMICTDSRNTISRTSFDAAISQVYDNVLRLFNKDGVPQHLARSVRAFEEKYKDESKADRIERVSSAIASAGLFVPDPVGGASNLRLPHKQFYEYLIAKACWITTMHRNSLTADAILTIDRRNPMSVLLVEEQSLVFYSEMIGSDLTVFKQWGLVVSLAVKLVIAGMVQLLVIILRCFPGKVFSAFARMVERGYRIEWDAEKQGAKWESNRDQRVFRMVPFLTALWSMISALFSLNIFTTASHAVQFSTYGGRLYKELTLLSFLGVGTFLIIVASRESPRESVLKRLVALKMVQCGLLRDEGMALGSFYRECLRLLMRGQKIEINPTNSKKGRENVVVTRDGELRDLIAPIA